MFCSNCGAQKDEGVKFCQQCGAGEETHGDTEIPRRPTPRPRPRPQASRNRLVEDSLLAIRQTFSVDPEKSVETAIMTKENIWLILGGIYCVITAIYMRVVFDAIIGFVLGGFGGFFLGEFQNRMLVFGFLTGALFLLAYSCAVKVLFALFRIDIPFTKVMDIVTSSGLIFILLLVFGILLSFISASLALGMYFLGAIAYYIMLYRGILKTADFRCSPFWVYCATMIVAGAVATPIIGFLASAVFTS